MSENVFQVFRSVGEVCPFIVQRTTSRSCLYLVTEVQPRGQYGEAFGYPVPVGPPLMRDAWPVNSHYGTTGSVGLIKNAGSYQWCLVLPQLAPAAWSDEWKMICSAAWERRLAEETKP